MRKIKSLILITMLLICGLANLVRAGKQENVDSFIKTLQSFDDKVLQSALRFKLFSAGCSLPGRETLVSLTGIDRVRAILPGLKEYGLTEEVVKTSIELKLRRNGIKLYDAPDDPNGIREFMLSHPDSVFCMAGLSLTIEKISLSKRDVVAASVDLSQSQTVALLSAERPTFVIVNTWHASQLLIGSGDNLTRGCREAIDELVDKYCNDWLATHTDKKRARLPQDEQNNGIQPRERTD